MFLPNKNAYTEKLFELLNPLLPYYSADGARLRIGFTGAMYSTDVAEAESFIRVLWGLGPFFSGGGENSVFEDIYQRGLANGTNPENEEYWGEAAGTGNSINQLFCEMAGIAVGLLLAPEKLWVPLSESAKNDLATWLNTINHHQMEQNNWQFFPVLVNTAFKLLGRDEYNETVLNQCLATIDTYYEGDGWYRDGQSNAHDYYIGFAFHYYGLIYAKFMKEYDPITAQKFEERALQFGSQFVYWFSSTGAAIPYGRSMTYRFAQVAYFSACIYDGIEPLPMSTMKGIIDRHLEYWWSTNMRELSGILSIGYAYPNLIMAEAYNSPGSPMWALKTFLLLALDDNHPYWSAEAGPFPVLEEKKWLPIPEMIVTQQPGLAILYTNGVRGASIFSGHMEEKYCKFAYCSKFGFNVRKANDSLLNMAPDSDLVFEYGGLCFGRDNVSSYTVSENEIETFWSPLPGINVKTTITPTIHGHSRHHVIDSTLECTVYDCGFAIPTVAAGFKTETDENSALIECDIGSCMLYTFSSTGSTSDWNGVIVPASPNCNLSFTRTMIPGISHKIPIGRTEFITTVIVT